MFVVLCEDGTAAPGRRARRSISPGKLVTWVAAAVLPWSAIITTGYLVLLAFE